MEASQYPEETLCLFQKVEGTFSLHRKEENVLFRHEGVERYVALMVSGKEFEEMSDILIHNPANVKEKLSLNDTIRIAETERTKLMVVKGARPMLYQKNQQMLLLNL